MDNQTKIPNPYEGMNTVTQASTGPASAPAAPTGTSQNTKNLVTVLLLIFVYPVGFFVMWIWSGWKVWLKLLVSVLGTILTLLIIGIFLLPFLLLAVNPSAQFKKAAELNNGVTVTIDNTVVTENGTTTNAFKDSFMSSCLKGSGNKQAYCECTYNYLEKSGIDFSNPASITELSKKIPDAIAACKNKALEK